MMKNILIHIALKLETAATKIKLIGFLLLICFCCTAFAQDVKPGMELSSQISPVQRNTSSPEKYATAKYCKDKQNSIIEEQSTQWEKKLQTLLNAKIQLQSEGEFDPGIGRQFIELATQQKATEYYELACDLYYWGFSPGIFKKTKVGTEKEIVNEVENEVARIVPLLDEREAKEWRDDLRDWNADLPIKIRRFWLEKDPTPTTAFNERLIEHWQRIAYARKHFTKNRRVYDCDDRGTIYVKYGEPQRKKTGTFGIGASGNLELLRWAKFSHRMDLKFYDYNPDYEVWLYNDIGTDESSIFLFSNRGGSGSFGLRNGVESVLPRLGHRLDERFLYRYLYQIMYYAELVTFDSYFSERYDQIEDIFLRDMRPRVRRMFLRGNIFFNEVADRYNPIYRYAHADKSDFGLAPIRVFAKSVRILNTINQPQQVFMVVSAPQLSASLIKDEKPELIIPDYRMKHILIIRDKQMTEVTSASHLVEQRFDNFSAFVIEHQPNHVHYTVAAEAWDSQLDTLLAVGKTFSRTSAPLNADPDSLELSDLLLGVDLIPGTIAQQSPFPLIPAQKILKRDPLKVYLEIYHLKRGESGVAHFTINFSVTKLDKKGRVRKKEGEISIILNLEAPGETSKEHFGINISKLKHGDYLLTARVKDTVSSQEKTRSARFTVLKK